MSLKHEVMNILYKMEVTQHQRTLVTRSECAIAAHSCLVVKGAKCNPCLCPAQCVLHPLERSSWHCLLRAEDPRSSSIAG